MPTQALTVFPGLERWRVRYAVHRWELGDFQRFIVPNLNRDEILADNLSLETLCGPMYGLNPRRAAYVHTEEWASGLHTGDNAALVTKVVEEYDLRSVTLITSFYHMPRSYLTLIKYLKDAGLTKVVIVPEPCPMPPHTRRDDEGCTVMQMLAGECARIPLYQEQGFVATWEEYQDYLIWLFERMSSSF